MPDFQKLTLRTAVQSDRRQLAHLIHFEPFVHRHMDWRPPLDWIGHSPYLIAEQSGNPMAALACPPDPPGMAWVRLFVSRGQLATKKAWEPLWQAAKEEVFSQQNPPPAVAAIAIQPWFQRLLEASAFEHTKDIIMLQWDSDLGIQTGPAQKGFHIRKMTAADLEAITAVDQVAFPPFWQISSALMALAYTQSNIATVAENAQGILGFQISTASPLGGHLARLAVLPSAQGQGIGTALVHDLQERFSALQAACVTVNTRKDNLVSLALYHKAGFHQTGNIYPIFQFFP